MGVSCTALREVGGPAVSTVDVLVAAALGSWLERVTTLTECATPTSEMVNVCCEALPLSMVTLLKLPLQTTYPVGVAPVVGGVHETERTVPNCSALTSVGGSAPVISG